MAAVVLNMRRDFQIHFIRITFGFFVQNVTPNDQLDAWAPFAEVPAGLRKPESMTK